MVSVACESYRHDIEHHLMTSIRHSLSASEEALCRLHDIALLLSVHAHLRGSLYVFLAGLDLYKMYSFGVVRDQIHLKMPAPPVPFKDGVAHFPQKLAGQVFSKMP